MKSRSRNRKEGYTQIEDIELDEISSKPPKVPGILVNALTSVDLTALTGFLAKSIVELKQLARLAAEIGTDLLKLLGHIFGGILGAGLAISSILDIYGTATNSELKQRKTRYATSFVTLAAAAVIIPILVGALIAAPIVVPLLFIGVIGVSIYRDQYILSSLRKTINQQEEELKTIQDEYEIAIINGNPSEIRQISYKKELKENELAANKISEKYTRYRRNTKIASLVGIGLLIGGLFFPPLAAVGLGMFLVTNIMQTVFNVKEKSALRKLAAEKQEIIAANNETQSVTIDHNKISRGLGVNPQKTQQKNQNYHAAYARLLEEEEYTPTTAQTSQRNRLFSVSGNNKHQKNEAITNPQSVATNSF
jgi:hypothetical protein